MALTVVCWMWRGERKYLPVHVNALHKMVRKHLTVPHRFVCIADTLDGFAPGIEVMPMPEGAVRLAAMRSPEGANMPSCYRRLWLFSEEARRLGDRVLLTDIDAIITGNIDHLVARTETFVGWRPIVDWGNKERVAGGMYLMTTGAHTEVYDDFNKSAIGEARAAGYRGSDQAWISYKLGKTAATWAESDGIYALSDFKQSETPPPDALVIHFCGHTKPWHVGVPKWVRAHYDDKLFGLEYPPTDYRRVILRHPGARIVVMGGAPSLERDISGLTADVWISVNQHGAKLRKVDYVVAMDDVHDTLKRDMRTLVREYTDAPIIGPWPTNDFQLHQWPGSPRKGLSGMVAAWVAWTMGAHPVILAGFDAYGGSKLNEGKRMAEHIPGEVRVVSGPLQRVWKPYARKEAFPEYVPHSSLEGLMGLDGAIVVRARKPTVVRGIPVQAGDEMRVMRHEVERLLHHRMLVEV